MHGWTQIKKTYLPRLDDYGSDLVKWPTIFRDHWQKGRKEKKGIVVLVKRPIPGPCSQWAQSMLNNLTDLNVVVSNTEQRDGPRLLGSVCKCSAGLAHEGELGG